MQTPSVGRVVHYVSHGTPVRADGTQAYTSQCRAAVVTAVRDMDTVDPRNGGVPNVDLFVMNPTGIFLNQSCRYHEGDPDHVDATPDRPTYAGGTWHWPERV